MRLDWQTGWLLLSTKSFCLPLQTMLSPRNHRYRLSSVNSSTYYVCYQTQKHPSSAMHRAPSNRPLNQLNTGCTSICRIVWSQMCSDSTARCMQPAVARVVCVKLSFQKHHHPSVISPWWQPSSHWLACLRSVHSLLSCNLRDLDKSGFLVGGVSSRSDLGRSRSRRWWVGLLRCICLLCPSCRCRLAFW